MRAPWPRKRTPREKQVAEYLAALEAVEQAGVARLESGLIAEGEAAHPGGLFMQNILTGRVNFAQGLYALLVTRAPRETDCTLRQFAGVHLSYPSGPVLATAGLTNITKHNGVLDADDVVFRAVNGSPASGVLLTNGPGILVAYIPFPTPLVPDGGDVTLAWDNGPYKIARLP